jgi:hypothetical protein
MPSDKQINANRQNGKNGGPKTPAGRAAVRNDALKHGLAAKHPVLFCDKEREAFDMYHEILQAELQPVGIMEQMLVDQIADAYWRRQRIIVLETGLFDITKAEIEKEVKTRFKDLTDSGFKHLIARTDARKEDMLRRYYRYDAQFERSFFKSWNALKSLQSARLSQTEPPASPSDPASSSDPAPITNITVFTEQTQIEPAPTPKIAPETPEKDPNAPSIM